MVRQQAGRERLFVSLRDRARRRPARPAPRPVLLQVLSRQLPLLKGGPMNYTKTVEKFGRLEEVFDMARFAADLAAELKGKVINPSAAPLDSDRDALEVDGVRLWLTVKSWGAGANSKVNVRACAPYFEGKYHDHPHGPDYKM